MPSSNSSPTRVSPASRWFPVFGTVLKQVAGRVKGFGRDPGLIRHRDRRLAGRRSQARAGRGEA